MALQLYYQATEMTEKLQNKITINFFPKKINKNYNRQAYINSRCDECVEDAFCSISELDLLHSDLKDEMNISLEHRS